jgi:hypothetical protein
MCQYHMAVANGRIAGWANIDRWAKPLKPFDQVQPLFRDVAHQPPRRILLICRLPNQKDITAANSAWVSSFQVACC